MKTNKENTLKVNEIFHSIQGESTLVGERCVLIRLTYCNLRCTYCDTEYAFYDGKDMMIDEIISEVDSHSCKLVEITGGEPLVQNNVHLMIKQLCNRGYNVMIETSGSLSIEEIDKRVKVIMDLKTPSSGMNSRNLYENIEYLKTKDEVKFVIGSREDYDWSKEKIREYNLTKRVQVLFSPIFEKIEPLEIVNWILEDKLDVRFQLQIHKFIWQPETRSV